MAERVRFTREDTELLTRVGPGTPMGELFRRYWIPALLSEELLEPDCPPVRVRLLGEDLLAFRDSHGRVGLIDPHCAHRGANLFLGRNLHGGITCIYHGWMYDVEGRCLAQPTEPPELSFKDEVRLKNYPCVDRGEVIWTYMGPPELVPEPPEFEWVNVAPEQRRVNKDLEQCSYLQAMEGGFDSAHLGFLHFGIDIAPGENPVGAGGSRTQLRAILDDRSPYTEVIESDGGLFIANRRNADDDHYYWRVNAFVLPFFQMIPAGPRGIGGHAWVPLDDENCWVFNYSWHPTKPREKNSPSDRLERIPGTFIPVANKSNDYLIDRELQRTTVWSGIENIRVQDIAVQESMGPIYDRSRENLGHTDVGIVALRRRLIEATRLVQEGKTPPGVQPGTQRIRSASIYSAKDVLIKDIIWENTKSGPEAEFAPYG